MTDKAPRWYERSIFADWYWDNHPEVRIVDANGDARKVIISSAGRPRRFSTTCPNEPGYRDFVVAQIEEISDGYEFEGVWPDMTFWPTVCYCASCRERYRREVGGEIPRVIDWMDPAGRRCPCGRLRMPWSSRSPSWPTSRCSRSPSDPWPQTADSRTTNAPCQAPADGQSMGPRNASRARS